MERTSAEEQVARPWSSPEERRRILTRLLPIDPSVLRDGSAVGRRAVRRLIAQAEASERARRAAGHWSASALRLDALRAAGCAEAATAAGGSNEGADDAP